MNSLPSNLKQIALFLQKLPGIGEKTANRLAFFFLKLPEADLQAFAENISTLKTKTKLCKICLNLTEDEICGIDQNPNRDKDLITVVEDVLDLIAFETGNIYQGVYHVLHGKIDPLNHVGPEDIFINQLLKRVNELTSLSIRQAQDRRANGLKKQNLKEIILAMNPDMEGEATAMYIRDRLSEIKTRDNVKFKVTRLAYGLPIGGSLEYAD